MKNTTKDCKKTFAVNLDNFLQFSLSSKRQRTKKLLFCNRYSVISILQTYYNK